MRERTGERMSVWVERNEIGGKCGERRYMRFLGEHSPINAPTFPIRLKRQLSGGYVPHLLIRGTSSRVQHVLGVPCLALSSEHVTLYVQFSTGHTWWFITAIAYTIHIPGMENALRLMGRTIQPVISEEGPGVKGGGRAGSTGNSTANHQQALTTRTRDISLTTLSPLPLGPPEPSLDRPSTH